MLQTHKLDLGWSFRRMTDTAWTQVDLPHSSVHVDLDGHGHWFGECEYRRTLRIENPASGVRYVLHVGAAMHTAIVLFDGVATARHTGGYLPFEADLTEMLCDGKLHELTLKIDNRDNPDIPPGKPFADLDFCWYGGLYRDVELRTYPPVHITDAVAAGEIGGGGVFVRTLRASPSEAVVAVKTQVRNSAAVAQLIFLSVELVFDGEVVAKGQSVPAWLKAGASTHTDLELTVLNPRLWSPASPALYQARVTAEDSTGETLDVRLVRFGIRRIGFSRSGGFVINGDRLRLRGTNRHQEYPYLGYALPRAAQVRDARLIKEAGFDYVRLSHYPQSPDFLDACDELGIVVMNSIPGWQYIGGEVFCDACCQTARDLIRRDRNHPCVVLWELSLNETDMPDAFMARLHAIGHEECPGDQMFTCGWRDRFDVYIHSRQHGELHRWSNGDKALVVAEYGDWEFYASNHGFDQKTGAGLHAAWSNSRQFRSAGERGLRQQVTNHVEALNDTLSSPAVLDGQWTAFDYVRGYHPVRAGTGVMDVFRLPKFSYHFYRSQRDAIECGVNWTGGAEVFIASYWTPASNLCVLVFSNCEEIELRLNGVAIGRQAPCKTITTQYLPHPPFVFSLPHFESGILEAVGLIGGKAVAAHRVGTPGIPVKIELMIEGAGVRATAGEPDLLFAHARWYDDSGNLCVEETGEVVFVADGDAEIIGPAKIRAEAGVASTLLRLPAGARSLYLSATACDNRFQPARQNWTL